MYFPRLSQICLLGAFVGITSALPYIFERAISDTTSLVPSISNIQQQLGPLLSPGATIYFPGTTQFENATSRWSSYAEPNVAIVVETATDKDVSTTIVYANKHGIPFLAQNRGHGSTSTLGKLQNGIEIYISALNNITVNGDGKSATVGGGVYTQQLIQTLWDQGKGSASGSCACVGIVGAALGGGLGRYQGYWGLVQDNIIDADLVLANGDMVTVSETSYPDLWWGLRGAGHNFGVVTSFNLKIYPYPVADWYFAQFVFTQDKLERFVTLVNNMMGNGTQRKELMNYFIYAWNPAISTTEPVIVFTIFYIGTKAEAGVYTQPFFDLGPSFQNDSTVPYPELSGATGLGLTGFTCQHGYNRLQYPVGLLTYNVSNARAVYELFKHQTVSTPALNLSTAVFEGYSLEGVKSVPSDSTAYPHRADNILASILAVYAPDPSLDSLAISWARQIRDLMQSGQPGRQLNAYVNYAFGDETQQEVYGYEPWRLQRLRGLKSKYDPQQRFSYYEPIVL